MRAPALVLASSLLSVAASAQVNVEWERQPLVPGALHAQTGTVVPIGSTGHVYVTGLDHSLVSTEYFQYVQPSGHLLLRLDEQGQIVWSRVWHVQPLPPSNSARSMDVAVDAAGDARIAYGTATSVVVLERRDATDGSVMWSTPMGPEAWEVVHGSLAVLADGSEIVALPHGHDFERVLVSADGAVLQSTVFATGLTWIPGLIATTDANGRLAVAGTGWGTIGVVAVFDANGAVAWSNAAVDMTVTNLAFGPGGVLAVVGYDSQARQRFRLYDANGSTLGSVEVQGSSPLLNAWVDVAFDPWGSPVAVGRRGLDATIAKFTAAGALEWDRTWSGVDATPDSFWGLLASPTGEYVAVGTMSNNAPSHGQRLAVTAWRRDGTLAWEHIDPPTANEDESAATILRTSTGSLVLVGTLEHRLSNNSIVPDGVELVSLRPQTSAFCFGDAASTSACPCGNASAPGALEGCANSVGSGGRLSDSGLASLANDSLALTVSGLPPTSTCLVFQTHAAGAAVFGDGVRCATGGATTRLYAAQASAGVATVPPLGGASLSARSASAGDPLQAGAVRYVQAYYRNSAPFCTPAGFNLSSGLILTWAP